MCCTEDQAWLCSSLRPVSVVQAGSVWLTLGEPILQDNCASCISADILRGWLWILCMAMVLTYTATSEPTHTACQAPSDASPISSTSQQLYKMGTMVVPALWMRSSWAQRVKHSEVTLLECGIAEALVVVFSSIRFWEHQFLGDHCLNGLIAKRREGHSVFL